MIRNLLEKISAKIMAKYIEFVYQSSKIQINGPKELIKKESLEKVIVLFWHGDSYCLYPALKDSKLYAVTTRDRRGDYITDMCHYFGYNSVRVPDESDGGNYLFKIRKLVNEEDISNLAVSADGPLGPYHIPKDFAIATAVLTKRRILPLTIQVKRKIVLSKRWDGFKIPLPFNKLIINFHNPVEVTREDRKEKYVSLKDTIKSAMEKEIA